MPLLSDGQHIGISAANGHMEPEMLRRILSKAKSECDLIGVGLFNWTEPLLHPKLPELIRIVQEEHGTSCFISSNLNTLRNSDEVMAANPYSLRISASGFTPEIYKFTHRGGDIERVKKNMTLLAEAKKRNRATTQIHVLYHRYKGNLEDELKMRRFADSLGFGFEPVWAYMMPLEKTLAFQKGDPDGVLTAEDKELIDYLAFPLDTGFKAAAKYKNNACTLQDDQVTIDCFGNVQLCCAVFDSNKFGLSSYLDAPLETIQKQKRNHDMCRSCASVGGHVYATFGALEFHKIAADNVAPEHARLLDLKYELRQRTFRLGLEWVYRKFFSRVVSPESSAMLGRQYDRLQRGISKLRQQSRP